MIISFFAFKGSGNSNSTVGGDKKPPKKKTPEDDESPRKNEPKTAELRGEFRVGPGEKHKTINAALAEIKGLKNHKSRTAVQIVRVAAGQTYAERIQIDEKFPRGIQIIAEPGPVPVLSPSGSEPAVVVSATDGKVENFHLEGFRIDAAGKEFGVLISDWATGAQFKRLEIVNFGKTGIHFHGAQTYGKEDERIIAESIVFRTSSADAVAVRIGKKTENSAYIRINQCRIFGPIECGVSIESDVRGIEISESIFSQTKTGIKFLGDERVLNDILIGADTFYQNDRAIVYTNMPTTRSRDFQYHNLLFVESKSADVVIEKDFQVAAFFLMFRSFPGGIGNNWTTRPAAESPMAGEFNNMFDGVECRRGVSDLQFVSNDPDSPEFLAPSPTAPQRQRATQMDIKRFGTQIGAVRGK